MKSRAQRYRYVRHVVSGTRPSPWSPLSLGSSLAAWYKADAGCYTDAACLFASASSQYVSRASSASIQMGDEDFTWAGWVYSAASTQSVVAKGDEVAIYRATGTFILRTDGLGTNDAQSNSVSGNAWHFVVASYESATKTNRIQVDDGSVASTTIVSRPASGSAALQFANDYLGVGNLDGSLARWGFWRRLLTAGERTSLYNAGAGKFYADLTTAEKVSLVEYWNLCESSGSRVGSHAGLSLTPTNGPTVAAGPGEGLCVDNSPCKRITDQSGNGKHLAQATLSLQYLWKASAQNGKPGLVPVDATSTYNVSLSLVQPFAWIVAGNMPLSTGLNQSILYGDTGLTLYRRGTDVWTLYAGTDGSDGPAADASWHSFVAEFSGASSLMWVDGTNYALSPANPGTDGISTLMLGAGSNPGTGYVGQIIVVSRATTLAERSGASAYLRAIYGTA